MATCSRILRTVNFPYKSPRMVKLVFLCRRRGDLSRERYAELLLSGHVPLALRHHPSMRGYAVNVVEKSPEGWKDLDSIGELWFESLQDYRERLYDSPAGREIIERDVARFLGGTDAYAASERIVMDELPASPLGARTPALKLVCPLARRPDMSHRAFVDEWLGRHAPLVRRRRPDLRKYVATIVDERLSPAGAVIDGFAELYFAARADSTEDLAFFPESDRILSGDLARFTTRAGSYLVAEYVEKRPAEGDWFGRRWIPYDRRGS